VSRTRTAAPRNDPEADRRYVAEIDKLIAEKEKEVMTV